MSIPSAAAATRTKALVLNDAAVKLVVNTKGENRHNLAFIPEIIAHQVIRYMDSGETGDEYTDKLNREVTSIRTDEKWRHDFMTLAQNDGTEIYG